jgi:hypothetical protein
MDTDQLLGSSQTLLISPAIISSIWIPVGIWKTLITTSVVPSAVIVVIIAASSLMASAIRVAITIAIPGLWWRIQSFLLSLMFHVSFNAAHCFRIGGFSGILEAIDPNLWMRFERDSFEFIFRENKVWCLWELDKHCN